MSNHFQNSWHRAYPPFDARFLVERYGSPLFVFFPGIFSENATRLKDALARRYRNCQINYSTKTNYLTCVLSNLPHAGVEPEVISGFEFEIVSRLGLLSDRTIVNGSFKSRQDLAAAAAAGAKINADTLEELELLNSIGSELERKVSVGLRIQAQLTESLWTRFGFHHEKGEVMRAAEYARDALPFVLLNGLHLHGGTNVCDTTYYAKASAFLVEIADQLSNQGLLSLEYLDIGGGFATDCPFLDATSWSVPSADEYAAAITGSIRERFGPEGPLIIVEPGRYLVDDAFLLLTTAQRHRGGSDSDLVMDAGINILPSAKFRRHQLRNLTAITDSARRYNLYGPLCMQSDRLGSDVELSTVRIGDVIGIDYAGAYSFSQAWTFIQSMPAVVQVDENTIKLVRRRQNVNDLLALDVS